MSTVLPHAASAPLRRTRRARSLGLALALASTVALPPFMMYIGLASSMAVGVMVVCLSALAFALWRDPGVSIWPSRRGSAIAWIYGCICAHAGVVLLTGRMDVLRFGLSLGLLLVFLLGTVALSRQLFSTSDAAMHGAATKTLVLLGLSGAMGLAGVAPRFGIEFGKPVFPFTEPSHFALSALPFFLYYGVTGRGLARQLALLAGVVASFALQNLTMLSAAALAVLICARPLTLALLSVPVVLALPMLDLQYFAARLDFSPESDNLSALVFAQGWQLIDESLRNSHFWGLGFQQLGVFGSQVEFAVVINALIGEDSNLSDGGFNFSKLVSEFGLFGLLATGLHLTFAGRFAMRLRRLAHRPIDMPRSTIFACAVVVSFTVDLFIRGNGYFTASSLMYVAAWMYLSSDRVDWHAQGLAGERPAWRARLPRRAAHGR